MSPMQHVSVLAVQQVLGERADMIFRFLGDHLTDHGLRLENALRHSAERAWRSLELSLAGASWWVACKGLLAPREEQTLARHVQTFLDKVPPAEMPGDAAAFRRDCLAELRSARRAKLIPGDRVGLGELAEEVRTFAAYGDPRRRIAEQRQRLDGLAELLRREGYGVLAVYVTLRPGHGEPLLVQACRYFFRRAVEADDMLSAGLTLETLEWVGTEQHAGFDALRQALDGHAEHLDALLAGLHAAVLEAAQAAATTRDEVRDIREQLARQELLLRQMAAALDRLLAQRPAAPAILGNGEVDRLLARCRTLTPAEQQTSGLARAIDEFTAAARQCETTRRVLHRKEGPLTPVPPTRRRWPGPEAEE